MGFGDALVAGAVGAPEAVGGEPTAGTAASATSSSAALALAPVVPDGEEALTAISGFTDCGAFAVGPVWPAGAGVAVFGSALAIEPGADGFAGAPAAIGVADLPELALIPALTPTGTVLEGAIACVDPEPTGLAAWVGVEAEATRVPVALAGAVVALCAGVAWAGLVLVGAGVAGFAVLAEGG